MEKNGVEVFRMLAAYHDLGVEDKVEVLTRLKNWIDQELKNLE